MNSLSCRFCGAALRHTFVDLGMAPPCQSIVREEQLNQMEAFYPLHAYVCHECLLVQLGVFVSPEDIFSEYAYFSSYSDTWLEHAKKYADEMMERFALSNDSLVVEIASNDGYLLQYFVEKGIPVLGVEPAANVAKVAEERGIPTEVLFFGAETARQLADAGKKADLIAGNNVLAQVPELNGFVAGLKTLLKSQGVITIEFPHLVRLMEENQFDTIYHEHFSYFSFATTERVFAAQSLTVFDVQELPTHGGSLRIYARHEHDTSKPVRPSVIEMREREAAEGYTTLRAYSAFGDKVRRTKRAILKTLIELKNAGKTVVGYGAPGKGNTLLNYCGIRTDFLDYTVDRNPHKQDTYTPGTHIPIYAPGRIAETKPDYVFILPWNLKNEIMSQMAHIRDWGGKFIVPIPEVRVFS